MVNAINPFSCCETHVFVQEQIQTRHGDGILAADSNVGWQSPKPSMCRKWDTANMSLGISGPLLFSPK